MKSMKMFADTTPFDPVLKRFVPERMYVGLCYHNKALQGVYASVFRILDNLSVIAVPKGRETEDGPVAGHSILWLRSRKVWITSASEDVHIPQHRYQELVKLGNTVYYRGKEELFIELVDLNVTYPDLWRSVSLVKRGLASLPRRVT